LALPLQTTSSIRRIFFTGKPEGKRPLGRIRYRWEDNIKTNLKEIW
jgi:hypothetical protein